MSVVARSTAGVGRPDSLGHGEWVRPVLVGRGEGGRTGRCVIAVVTAVAALEDDPAPVDVERRVVLLRDRPGVRAPPLRLELRVLWKMDLEPVAALVDPSLFVDVCEGLADDRWVEADARPFQGARAGQLGERAEAVDPVRASPCPSRRVELRLRRDQIAKCGDRITAIRGGSVVSRQSRHGDQEEQQAAKKEQQDDGGRGSGFGGSRGRDHDVPVVNGAGAT